MRRDRSADRALPRRDGTAVTADTPAMLVAIAALYFCGPKRTLHRMEERQLSLVSDSKQEGNTCSSYSQRA